MLTFPRPASRFSANLLRLHAIYSQLECKYSVIPFPLLACLTSYKAETLLDWRSSSEDRKRRKASIGQASGRNGVMRESLGKIAG